MLALVRVMRLHVHWDALASHFGFSQGVDGVSAHFGSHQPCRMRSEWPTYCPCFSSYPNASAIFNSLRSHSVPLAVMSLTSTPLGRRLQLWPVKALWEIKVVNTTTPSKDPSWISNAVSSPDA